MQLLLDTDAFCKLAACSLLEPMITALGGTLDELRRLAALPHMLARGRLRKILGPALADQLIPLAQSIATIPPAPAAWLDQLVPIPGIDAGEAQLLALAAEHEVLLLTADKRALRALSAAPRVVAALDGKVVTWEAALSTLLGTFGSAQLHQRLQPARHLDRIVEICFSPHVGEPEEALASYLSAVHREVAPLRLWTP